MDYSIPPRRTTRSAEWDNCRLDLLQLGLQLVAQSRKIRPIMALIRLVYVENSTKGYNCWINNTRVLPSVSLNNSSGKELVRWGSIDVNQFTKDYERSTVSLSMHFNHPWIWLSYRIRVPMFLASWLTKSFIYIQQSRRQLDDHRFTLIDSTLTTRTTQVERDGTNLQSRQVSRVLQLWRTIRYIGRCRGSPLSAWKIKDTLSQRDLVLNFLKLEWFDQVDKKTDN